MLIKKRTEISIGADVSRTPPIHRPLAAFTMFRFICESVLSALGGYSNIQFKSQHV